MSFLSKLKVHKTFSSWLWQNPKKELQKTSKELKHMIDENSNQDNLSFLFGAGNTAQIHQQIV